MFKVNRKVEYALVALRHMYTKPKGSLTSVREICERYGTPFDPLAHVLRILNSHGVLQSEQGARGGYRLLLPLTQIDMASFVQMIDGQVSWVECSRGEQMCRCELIDSCNIIDSMHQFNALLIAFLKSFSIADLLQLNGEIPLKVSWPGYSAG